MISGRSPLAAVVAVLTCGLAALGWAGPEGRALSFPVGQDLVYRIYWGVIPVGESFVKTQWVEEDGRRLLAATFRTRTNKFMERIYPVDDRIESLIDPGTLLPVRFIKKLSEGRYRCHEVTDFDHARRVARWESKTNGRTKEFEIDAETRDIVSFMYYARAMDFVPGQKRQFRVMADEKLYDLYVKPVGTEDVELENGKRLDCVKLEPEAAFEGLFVRKGRMWLWISRAAPRMVARLVARVPVASVKLVLAEVVNPGEDMVVQAHEQQSQEGKPSDDPET